MPILHIKALPQKDTSRVQKAIKRTAQNISDYYQCSLENVSITWDEIKTGFYFQGDQEASKQPTYTHPPIGELICLKGKTAEQSAELLKIVAKTLGDELGIPGNIFITYREIELSAVQDGDK